MPDFFGVKCFYVTLSICHLKTLINNVGWENIDFTLERFCSACKHVIGSPDAFVHVTILGWFLIDPGWGRFSHPAVLVRGGGQ